MPRWRCIKFGTHGHTTGCDSSGTGTYATVTREANKHMRETEHATAIWMGAGE